MVASIAVTMRCPQLKTSGFGFVAWMRQGPRIVNPVAVPHSIHASLLACLPTSTPFAQNLIIDFNDAPSGNISIVEAIKSRCNPNSQIRHLLYASPTPCLIGCCQLNRRPTPNISPRSSRRCASSRRQRNMLFHTVPNTQFVGIVVTEWGLG